MADSTEIQSLHLKLDMILDNQKDQLTMLRNLANKTQGPDGEDIDDLVPKPMDTVEELEQLCNNIINPEEPQLRKLLVSC